MMKQQRMLQVIAVAKDGKILYFVIITRLDLVMSNVSCHSWLFLASFLSTWLCRAESDPKWIVYQVGEEGLGIDPAVPVPCWPIGTNLVGQCS